MEKEIETQKFLTQMFKNYYSSHFNERYCPTDIEFREFGFVYWDANKFMRHLGFLNFKDLSNHVSSNIPKHVYCSATRYESPDAPNMKLKSYINCDLIFDLDIDHFPTPCKEDHDKWTCKQCGTTGRGSAPKICPSKGCDSKSFEEFSWECEKCMEIAKSEIITIIEEFLSKDFGLNPHNELYIVFSGRRGYHIHVENEFIRELDTNARREIVDYIMGHGLVPKYLGFDPKSSEQKKPNILDLGWRGRMPRFVLRLLEESMPDELKKLLIGIDVDSAKQELISQLKSNNPPWSFAKIGEKTWSNLIQTAVNKYGGKLDQPVTIDIHRLIRLPGSLHGATGFLVKKLSFNELEKFDPFSHAWVFQGTRKILIKETPQFRIGNDIFGPFQNETIELPTSAAVYLMSKGLAYLC
ncbi:MAG TPA: DNA primase small subunit domain-containing protein [Candidatus Deferrimicrobium sp.]|nr:DNA primase small subunit domain-containing protein [Candidatus Deferrimicrobium sp.]